MFRSWMLAVALVACLSSPAVGGQQVAPLDAVDARGLEQMRAGSGERPAGLSAIERESLEQVQAQHADLSELRAGRLSSSDILMILKIIGSVVLLIALLS